MRLRYIELFHAVLTTGSLTGAAKLLNISQPAASKALQHAEDKLGFALFSRVRGRLQPTQQALQLRDRIEKIIQDVHELQRLTTNMGGLLMVALRSQGNWRWEGPLGTPLGLVHWKRASSPVEAGTAGYL